MKNIDEVIRRAPIEYQLALNEEKQAYQRIHEAAQTVLSEVGIATKNNQIISLLESTGLAGYDGSTGRIYLLPELIDRSIELAAKTYPGDEGMNTLGIGGIPPFLYRESGSFPLPATYEELAHLINLIKENLDVVRFFSQPVKVHNGDPLKCNQMMDQISDCLKVTCSAYMDDENAVQWFTGRDDWHDSICGIKSPLICMDDMMDALVKSAKAGNNLRLTTMPLAGRTAPQTPEACIIITHAEVMFMLALAQTVNPGILCMHGGMPCPTRPDGNLAYSHDAMDLLNVAVARLNMWLTGLPTVQSGGSTEEREPGRKALEDGIRGRYILCDFGVHHARHCFGALDNLNFFSEAAFIKDCEAHRQYQKNHSAQTVLKPLCIPKDDQAFDVIQRIGSGDYYSDYHTTANIYEYDQWVERLNEKGLLPT
jgi:trimethylamine--corrinoid protein Co-methyltransferase